jgi:hypothetical protein
METVSFEVNQTVRFKVFCAMPKFIQRIIVNALCPFKMPVCRIYCREDKSVELVEVNIEKI